MSEFVKVLKVTENNYDTKTIEFETSFDAKPGQFVMVWRPGMEEIPMSLSATGRVKSISVKRIGPDTEFLHQIKAGDTLGIRGPYGNGYDLSDGRKYLIIGGGIGTASIMPAVEASGADTIIGGRSEADLVLRDRAEKAAKNVWYSTDDGSFGFHGNTVQLFREKQAENHYDCVVACGPEVMLFFLYKACEELGVDCQLSLERHMKCGAGVCGCCVMDGQRVCKDGPVFNKSQIAQLKDFGVQKRDECGRVVKFRKG
jgi:dihydroorotate dehydrogenase electron transfer subunit